MRRAEWSSLNFALHSVFVRNSNGNYLLLMCLFQGKNMSVNTVSVDDALRYIDSGVSSA